MDGGGGREGGIVWRNRNKRAKEGSKRREREDKWVGLRTFPPLFLMKFIKLLNKLV